MIDHLTILVKRMGEDTSGEFNISNMSIRFNNLDGGTFPIKAPNYIGLYYGSPTFAITHIASISSIVKEEACHTYYLDSMKKLTTPIKLTDTVEGDKAIRKYEYWTVCELGLHECCSGLSPHHYIDPSVPLPLQHGHVHPHDHMAQPPQYGYVHPHGHMPQSILQNGLRSLREGYMMPKDLDSPLSEEDKLRTPSSSYVRAVPKPNVVESPYTYVTDKDNEEPSAKPHLVSHSVATMEALTRGLADERIRERAASGEVTLELDETLTAITGGDIVESDSVSSDILTRTEDNHVLSSDDSPVVCNQTKEGEDVSPVLKDEEDESPQHVEGTHR